MTVKAVREAIAAVYRGKDFNTTEQRTVERLLTDHECWVPLFQLLDNSISKDQQHNLAVFLHKIRIEIKYLGDHEQVAQRAQEIVKRFGIDFTRFRLDILGALEGNWQLEADVLKSSYLHFKALPDRVKCLERICALYEKKIPDDGLLQKFYRELIKIDPKNIRALKYFKVLHSQNFDWERVIDALHKIMKWGNISDTYRSAQELAAVHLYSRNDPQEALRIMTKHCADSPLDKSTILYDIYARLGDDRACIALLKKKLATIRRADMQAQLHVRIAALQEKCGRDDAAIREYTRAFEKDHKMVEVVEKIIAICVRHENWRGVLSWLRKLENSATDRTHIERLKKLTHMVKEHLAALRVSA